MGVSIVLVRALVEATEVQGVRRQELLAAAHFDEALLENPEARIPLEQYDLLQSSAIRMTSDEALGLHLGERVSLSTFDIVGPLLLSAPTIREGINVLLRYHRILNDCADSSLLEDGDTAVLRYEYPRSSPRVDRMRAEFGLVSLLRAGQVYVGSDKLPRRVRFEHAAPAYVHEYTRIFGPNVTFGEPFTALDFDREWLDRHQLHQNPPLYTLLENQAEIRLRKLDPRVGLADRVRAALAEWGPTERPNMDEVAKRLGMSARSLRRRLKREGVPYGSVIDEALGHTARRMLQDPNRTLQEIAYAMGFSEPSAFHRAFKRWTGLTPRQYRIEAARGLYAYGSAPMEQARRSAE